MRWDGEGNNCAPKPRMATTRSRVSALFRVKRQKAGGSVRLRWLSCDPSSGTAILRRRVRGSVAETDWGEMNDGFLFGIFRNLLSIGLLTLGTVAISGDSNDFKIFLQSATTKPGRGWHGRTVELEPALGTGNGSCGAAEPFPVLKAGSSGRSGEVARVKAFLQERCLNLMFFPKTLVTHCCSPRPPRRTCTCIIPTAKVLHLKPRERERERES